MGLYLVYESEQKKKNDLEMNQKVVKQDFEHTETQFPKLNQEIMLKIVESKRVNVEYENKTKALAELKVLIA